MNPFLAALSDLRVTGAILLHESYRAGSRIRVPGEPVLRSILGQDERARLAPFHFVLSGAVDLTIAGRPKRRLVRGDVLICLDAREHTLDFGQPVREASFEDLVMKRAGLRPGEGGTAVAELVCGVFAVRPAPLNPLMGALPALLHLETDREAAPPTLALAARMLALGLAEPDEMAASFTRARLLEIIFAEAIRAACPATSVRGSFLAAQHDGRISSALSAFHGDPAAAWTVAKLAERAALSPSRFSARFRERLGVSVMDYVANWRLSLASRLVEMDDQALEEVAEAVGYGSAAALSRAFRERIGLAPGRWRAANANRHQEAARVSDTGRDAG